MQWCKPIMTTWCIVLSIIFSSQTMVFINCSKGNHDVATMCWSKWMLLNKFECIWREVSCFWCLKWNLWNHPTPTSLLRSAAAAVSLKYIKKWKYKMFLQLLQVERRWNVWVIENSYQQWNIWLQYILPTSNCKTFQFWIIAEDNLH